MWVVLLATLTSDNKDGTNLTSCRLKIVECVMKNSVLLIQHNQDYLWSIAGEN